MAFAISTEQRHVENGCDNRFYLLRDGDNCGADVWPGFGFNCVRWFSTISEKRKEWLYAASDLLEDTRPTRSGIPVLFPFPNRIRDGHFRWDDKDYRLPLNDPTGKNAIHGFACRSAWRVIDQGADDHSAWLTGEFHAAKDAPRALGLWPADHRIRLTYRLQRDRLRIQTDIDNPGETALPFGLGFHPYFQMFDSAENTRITVPARQFWQLNESLPTGVTSDVTSSNNLLQPRSPEGLHLDDVLTDLEKIEIADNSELMFFGEIASADDGTKLQVTGSPVFRDVVVFTPPHGRAICIEPYTCVTDAVNLQQQGIGTGLITITPGQTWPAVVEFVIASQ